jgi:acetylornithine deacetylase/succinyl-diaminopimelate desuccinylase-like protein
MRMSLSLATATTALLALAPAAAAQSPPPAAAVRRAAEGWARSNQHAVMRELAAFLSLPNIASDRAGIRRNADSLVAMMRRRGIEARLLELDGSPPAVFGELRVPGATRTVVLYAHYDGQPVDSSAWRSPPWSPVLRDGLLERGAREVPWPAPGRRFENEWRIYARSASDDKSPIVAILAALDALGAANIQPSVNLKFFFEGEEEAGSPNLRAMLQRHGEALRADAWIFADGPVHQSRRPQLVYGVRGTMGFQVTVYGPLRPLHSGHYGNWAPNPGVRLAHLIAAMRDEEGQVLIEGFYDAVRVPSRQEREALAAMPPVDAALRAELGIAASEAGNAPLAERIMLPALNVQGIEMARVGRGAANVIPTEATAAFGVRLVPEQTPERIRELVLAHLRRGGWHLVESEPDSATRARHPRLARVTFGAGGYPATRTPMDSPFARAVVSAIQPGLAAPLIRVPILGGSLPLHHFGEVLGVPLIILPMVNHDNNQHGANENLRLANLWEGIALYAVMMARLGGEWGPGDRGSGGSGDR